MLSNGNLDKEHPGFCFYEPQPYLLVTAEVPKTDAKPKDETDQGDKKLTPQPPTSQPAPVYTIQIVYLPDYSKPYRLCIQSGLGNNEHSFKLANGWQLTDVDSKTNTEIPETITAVSSLLKAVPLPKARAPGSGAKTEEVTLEPGLYRIDFCEKLPYLTKVLWPEEYQKLRAAQGSEKH